MSKADIKKGTEDRFSKRQFLESALFSGKRDLLQSLLEEETSYTAKEVVQMIDDYMKKEVE